MAVDIVRRKTLNAGGLNAGTSADGLDLAAVSIARKAGKFKISLKMGRTVPYPKPLAISVRKAVTQGIDTIDEFIILDRKLGQFYGEQAKIFCRTLKQKGFKTNIVASHGQTIRHLPGRVRFGGKSESGTLQAGHPETIAALTGVLTVADFRQADIGSGGEGAPITSGPMWHLFSDKKESRLLVNIGGIANYFYFPGGKPVDLIEAGDCGPGNSLLDIIAGRFFRRKYDRDGYVASRGQISQRLLSILMSDNYLKGKYGPSTGRERFGEKFVNGLVHNARKLKLNKYDIMATAAELTAVSIAAKISRIIKDDKITSIYTFGGGARNKFLIKRLRKNLPGTELISVDTIGYNADYLEAACYAIMGAMTIWSLPVNPKHVTGAHSKVIAGRIIQSPAG